MKDEKQSVWGGGKDEKECVQISRGVFRACIQPKRAQCVQNKRLDVVLASTSRTIYAIIVAYINCIQEHEWEGDDYDKSK